MSFGDSIARIEAREGLTIKVLRLHELEDKCVYEFALGQFNNEHWKETSAYVTWENFNLLSPYIDDVIPSFNYYGPNLISVTQWERLKEKIKAWSEHDSVQNTDLIKLFNEIDRWVQESFKTHGFFSILGP